MRFTIAGLMAVVLVFAIGFAGLRLASSFWASGLFTATVVVLASAVVAVALSRGRAQAVWLGFTGFGWTYLLATFWLWPVPNGVTAPPLLTKALIDDFQPNAQFGTLMTVDTGPRGEPVIEQQEMQLVQMAGKTFKARIIDLIQYRRIAHTLAAIAFGILGALVGVLITVRKPAMATNGPAGVMREAD